MYKLVSASTWNHPRPRRILRHRSRQPQGPGPSTAQRAPTSNTSTS